jgi:hypothetical protein
LTSAAWVLYESRGDVGGRVPHVRHPPSSYSRPCRWSASCSVRSRCSRRATWRCRLCWRTASHAVVSSEMTEMTSAAIATRRSYEAFVTVADTTQNHPCSCHPPCLDEKNANISFDRVRKMATSKSVAPTASYSPMTLLATPEARRAPPDFPPLSALSVDPTHYLVSHTSPRRNVVPPSRLETGLLNLVRGIGDCS